MPLPQPAAQDDTLSELPELINRQLTEKGLKIEKASAAVIDATIIQTAGSKQRQAIEVDEEGQVSGQTKRNRYLSKTRYVVEQSFGTLHRKFRYARAAYFGLLKVSAQSHLKAMCLNLLKAANRPSVPVAA